MSTTTRAQPIEADLNRPPYTRPTGPKATPTPLAHLSDDEYTLLIDQILEDWDCPTMSELGLCRAHRLSLEELDRITDDPAFDRALARIRSIREKRRPEREAAAHARITDRLLGLLAQPQDTAARAREVRLAARQLLTLLGTGAAPRAPHERAAPSPPTPRRPTPERPTPLSPANAPDHAPGRPRPHRLTSRPDQCPDPRPGPRPGPSLPQTCPTSTPNPAPTSSPPSSPNNPTPRATSPPSPRTPSP